MYHILVVGRHILAASSIALGCLGLIASQSGAQASNAAAPATAQVPKPNPVGVGSTWKANVSGKADVSGKAEAGDDAYVSGRAYSDVELDLIRSVNAYFNGMRRITGRFVQTSADKDTAKGKFFVQRPGRFRFVYSPPSRLVILSDGRYLSIEDHDLKTVDRYPLNSTPFRILLKEHVDILRDARVVEIVDGEEEVALSLLDKAGDGSGRIRLLFAKVPEFVLKAWTVTDAQGFDTKIEVAHMALAEKFEPGLFMGSKIGLPGFSSNDN